MRREASLRKLDGEAQAFGIDARGSKTREGEKKKRNSGTAEFAATPFQGRGGCDAAVVAGVAAAAAASFSIKQVCLFYLIKLFRSLKHVGKLCCVRNEYVVRKRCPAGNVLRKQIIFIC